MQSVVESGGNMKDWDSKIVSVLANYNVVEIKDQKKKELFLEIMQ